MMLLQEKQIDIDQLSIAELEIQAVISFTTHNISFGFDYCCQTYNQQDSYIFKFRGQDNQISVITVSRSGDYVASGQRTYMGFQADIIIWDFKQKKHDSQIETTKVQIQSLNQAALGGIDDKNMLIVWDIKAGKALYGTPNRDPVNKVQFYNQSDEKLKTVLNTGVQILTIDKQNKKVFNYFIIKIQSVFVNFGNIKRTFIFAAIDKNDKYCYCDTKTGDVFEIQMNMAIYKRLAPVKKLFSQGVNCLGSLPNGDIIVEAVMV
ncbi:unnamed protein product [Paramecium octaurelia]|uniref:WD40-repeat-containing domain n=1 Tax=Paramecium octaurelia TaxID=43137 RepID=A0A8S1XTT3_PAROT|nr:unnamed protein product [Paramecium octaurelia]